MFDALRTVNNGHMTDGYICWCNPRYFINCLVCNGEDVDCDKCDEDGMMEIFDVEAQQTGILVVHNND